MIYANVIKHRIVIKLEIVYTELQLVNEYFFLCGEDKPFDLYYCTSFQVPTKFIKQIMYNQVRK